MYFTSLTQHPARVLVFVYIRILQLNTATCFYSLFWLSLLTIHILKFLWFCPISMKGLADTIDWLKTFKQAYHIHLSFDRIKKCNNFCSNIIFGNGHTHMYFLVSSLNTTFMGQSISSCWLIVHWSRVSQLVPGDCQDVRSRVTRGGGCHCVTALWASCQFNMDFSTVSCCCCWQLHCIRKICIFLAFWWEQKKIFP